MVEIDENLRSRLDRIRRANRLYDEAEALELLVDEYDTTIIERYPGGYSQFLLDYEPHLANLVDGARHGRVTLGSFATQAFPNNFLYARGVTDIVRLRRNYGIYASDRLGTVDQPYRQNVVRLVGWTATHAGFEAPVAQEVGELLAGALHQLEYTEAPIENVLYEASERALTSRAIDAPWHVRQLLERVATGLHDSEGQVSP